MVAGSWLSSFSATWIFPRKLVPSESINLVEKALDSRLWHLQEKLDKLKEMYIGRKLHDAGGCDAKPEMKKTQRKI